MTNNKNIRVVVLGAGGFLGRAMAGHLHDEGYEVVGCDFRSPTQGTQWKCESGDVSDSSFLDEVFATAQAVFHFASATNASTNSGSIRNEINQAFLPLLGVIEACQRNGVGKLAYPSSGGTVYQRSSKPCTEGFPLEPGTPYALVKTVSEQLLLFESRQHPNLTATILRIGNPYGPGQTARPGQGVVAHWIKSIKTNQPIRVFGDLAAARDFIYVDDACRLMEAAVFRSKTSDIFNIGSGQPTSLKMIYEALCLATNRQLEIQIEPGRSFDRDTICLDPSKVIQLANEFRFTDLEDGIQKTIAEHVGS